MLFRYAMLTIFFCGLWSNAQAQTADNLQCHQQKYQAYHQAANQWYQSLATEAVRLQPTLQDSANAFLQQHQQLSRLNLAAFHWLWENQAQTLNLKQSVENWLTLDQSQIQLFSQQTHPLSDVAMPVYQTRQIQADQHQYELRKQFASLFKPPFHLQLQLDAYNQLIRHINGIHCEKSIKVINGS